MIAGNLAKIENNLRRCATEYQRSRAPTLVAVSKFHPVSSIQAAYDAGHRVFGENYVQELVSKASELPSDIEWHFIGSLQSNKSKMLLRVPNLAMVHSVDSLKLALALSSACGRAQRTAPLRVLVQVNTSGEGSKGGADPEKATELYQQIRNECPELKVCGFMTIGALGGDPLRDFRCLRDVRDGAREALGLKEGEALLSMGMSGDYAEAVREGSDYVRVGSAIFGSRPVKAGGGKEATEGQKDSEEENEKI